MDFFEIRKPVRKVGLDQYIVGSDPTNPLVKIDGNKLDVDELSVLRLNFETGTFNNIKGEYHEYASGRNDNLFVGNLEVDDAKIKELLSSTGIFDHIQTDSIDLSQGSFDQISGLTGIFNNVSGASGYFNFISIDGKSIDDKLKDLEESISSIDFSSGIIVSGHITAANDPLQFVKSFISGEQYIYSTGESILNFNSDNYVGSQDWKLQKQNYNYHVFSVEDIGFYDIDFSWKHHSGDNIGDVLSASCFVYKRDSLTSVETVLGTDVKFKTDAGFIEEYREAYSQALNPVVNIKNVLLKPTDEIYATALHYSPSTGNTYKVSTEIQDTYINIEKKISPASGAFTFEDLIDTPSSIEAGAGKYLKVSLDGTQVEYSDVIEATGNIFAKISIEQPQYLNNASGLILNFDGPLSSGSKEWVHYGDFKTLKGSDPGFYDIDFEWTYENSQDLGGVLKSSSNVYKVNALTNEKIYLGSDVRFKQDAELIEEYKTVYNHRLNPKVNLKNIYLNTDDYIVAEIEHFSVNTGYFSVSTNPRNTYLSMQRQVNTAGASNFTDLLDTPFSLISGSGKFLKVSDDEKSIILTDEIKAGSSTGVLTGTITGSINRYELKEAFELDEFGDIIPSNAEQISDNMWILKNDQDLELRANLWRYNTGPEAFTEDISF